MSFEILKSQVHVLWEIAQHEPRSHIAFLSHAHYRAQYDNEGCRTKLFAWKSTEYVVYYDRVGRSVLCPTIQLSPKRDTIWVYDYDVILNFHVEHIMGESFIEKWASTYPTGRLSRIRLTGDEVNDELTNASTWCGMFDLITKCKHPPPYARAMWLHQKSLVKPHLQALEAAHQNSWT